MQEELLYEILRYPVVSEKSTHLSVLRKYVFKVKMRATKAQVKRAVEKIFKVKVAKVNSSNTKGKVKIFKRVKGVQNDYKKAIVTLEENNEIDLSVGIK
jgi:large subunit ribosomal protein L23